MAPSPYLFIINVHLVAINVFAKFDEIPSLPVQDMNLRKNLNVTDGQIKNYKGQ